MKEEAVQWRFHISLCEYILADPDSLFHFTILYIT